MKPLSPVIAFAALTACHPLSLFAPPRIDPRQPLVLEQADNGPQSPVEVLLDERGVPHIYGQSEADLAYGLGFMHGRDRLFQVTVLKHAAYGRLTELFGKDLLPIDRRLRLLSWKLDEAYAALDARDRAILEAYAQGLNAAVTHAGRSAELVLLRAPAPVFVAKDSLAIGRLQSWQLSGDFNDELLRARLLRRLAANDARAQLLTAPASSLGVPVVESPRGAAQASEMPTLALAELGNRLRSPGLDSPRAQAISDFLGLEHPGASNSWAVSGKHTASGSPVLCNDPHLQHGFPSVFYLAHLEHPDFTVVGATFPGLPAVLIGHTRHLAWGMTTSYADTQDLLRVSPAAGNASQYLLDGTAHDYEATTQVFRFGSSESAPSFSETWKSTSLGPLLPPVYSLEGEGQLPYVLHWPALHAGGVNARPFSGFFDFARATHLNEAREALALVPMAAQNVTLAFTDGTIGYQLAAYTFARPAGSSGKLPREVTRSADAAGPALPASQMPSLENPPSGYVVTANQRVVDDTDPRTASVGTHGAPAHRAERIHERLGSLLKRDKVSADELLAIQNDVQSTEARALGPLLANHCPREVPGHSRRTVHAFCKAVNQFDGRFTLNSTSALPYALLLQGLRREVVKGLGEVDSADIARAARSLPVVNAVEAALRAGPSSPLFRRHADAESSPDLPGMLLAATEAALNQLGENPNTWRWGNWHTLDIKGQLAVVPGVGSFFKGPTRAQPGYGSTVRAEGGLPVEHGSALRMVVELGATPRGRFVIDSGQSGHPRDAHAFDQFEDWNAVKPRPIVTERNAVEAQARARLTLKRR